MHLPLNSERTAVHEAPAVYLVEPTSQNVDIILRDLESRLYRRYYINFTTSISKTFVFITKLNDVNNKALLHKLAFLLILYSTIQLTFSQSVKQVVELIQGKPSKENFLALKSLLVTLC